MVLFNYSTKEITAKVVYYGPGLCGKTTNLQFIYDNMPKNIQRGRMLSLATKTDRTLFFDFLPLDLGNIREMKTRVQLYTVPGQVFYNSTRKLVLKGADGIVFVADSQETMRAANIVSLANLEENCAENGIDLSETPLILQFNKRDLPDLIPLEELNEMLNKYNAPFFESVATTGIGVHESLKGITKLVIRSLQQRHEAKDADEQAEEAVEAVSSQVVAEDAVVPPTMEQPVAAMAPPTMEQPVPPAVDMPPVETVAPEIPPVTASMAAEAATPASGLPAMGATAEAGGEAAPPPSVSTGPEETPAEVAAPQTSIIEGLLRRADSANAAEENGAGDLAAELTAEKFEPSPGVTESPAEGVIPAGAQPPAPVALQENDPLGLCSGPMTATPSTAEPVPQVSLPVVLRPGQEEIHIPLEVRAGQQVQRYRLRLHISLGPED